MNEKLKEAVRAWCEEPGYTAEWVQDFQEAQSVFGTASPLPAPTYALLSAAARGEIPGFRLLDEDAAKDAERYRHWRKAYVNMTDGYEETYDAISISETEDQFDAAIDAAMLTASREEQK